MWGFASAATMRSVIGCAVHAQLRVHAGDNDVESCEQILLLVERAVLEDVDLDAGEDAERRQLFVELGDDLELLAQPLGAEPVRNLQRRRVVGERHVLMTEIAACRGHQSMGDRRRTSPSEVQVALQRGADRRPGPSSGAASGLETGEILGHLAGEGLHDHPGGAAADAEAGPGGVRVLASSCSSSTGDVADGIGRAAKRLHLVRRRPLAAPAGSRSRRAPRRDPCR